MKKLFLILLSLFLFSCSTANVKDLKPKENIKLRTLTNYKDEDNLEFKKFMDDAFIEISNSFDLATYFLIFEDAEQFNINKPKVIYNEISYDSAKNDDINQNLLERLHQFDFFSLSKIQQNYFRNLEFALDREIIKNNFFKYDEQFEPTEGVQTIPYYFISLKIDSEEKLNDYIKLFKEYPNYVNQALIFSQKQFDDNLFMNKFKTEDSLKEVENIIENYESDFTSDFETKLDNLNIKNKNEKLNEFKTILSVNKESYFKIKDFLNKVLNSGKLSDKGFYNLKDGDKYFEILVSDNLGYALGVSKLKELLELYLNNSLKEMAILYNSSKNKDYYNFDYHYTPLEIIEIAKNSYTDKFPKVDNFDYLLEDIKEKGRENRAHYVPRKIGSKFGGTIRIPEMLEKDFNNFTMMIHEAIPGHLYQFNYYENLNRHPLMRLLSYRGYSEGWAMYVERYGLDYFKDLDKDKMTINLILIKINVILSSLVSLEVNTGLNFEDLYKKYSHLIPDKTIMEQLYKRSISDPLDDLAYGAGWVLFDSFYEYATENLKDKFDHIKFHQVLLDYGNRPFDYILLDIDEYVESVK